LAGSFRRALGSSWPLYVALALTWLPLAAFNLHGPRTPVAGFGLGVSGLQWWCTQTKVLFLYLKLTVWPWPLVIHYDIPYFDSIAAAWPWIALTSLLIALIVYGVYRGSAWGFVGTWIFAVLSPTLLIPLTAEIAAERRMYVVLAALMPATVVGCYALLRRAASASDGTVVESKIPFALTLAAALALAGAYSLIDLRRLSVYTDKLALWSDAAENQPNSPIIQLNLATALEAAGRKDEAVAHYFRAVELQPNHFVNHFKLA
ncbi:MAG TPA: tetratricopeptide repeat protein, partial [Pirellulales bacterium]